MGLFGVGELSDVGLLAPNHLIALALGGFTVGLLAVRQLLFRQNRSNWFVLMALCLVAGMASAFLAKVVYIATYRDTAAILLSIALGLSGGAIFRHLGERIFWAATLVFSLLNVLIFPVALLLGEFPGMTVWYGDRFLGVSRNPNQTALLCVIGIIAAVRLWILTRGISRWTARVALIGAAGNLVVGMATRSSAFRVAVMVAIGCFFAGLFVRRRTSPALRGFAASTFLLACFAVVFLHPETMLFRAAEEDGGIVRNTDQFDYRFQLWKESIKLVEQFPLFGRGGGAAGGTFDIMLEYDAMEAHNTLIDLAIATGLVGLIGFSWKILHILSRLWRANLMRELALAIFLLTFAMFHNLLRQPLLWILIAAFEMWPEGNFLWIARSRPKAAVLQRRGPVTSRPTVVPNS